jgi:hypothetical protein
MILSIYAGIPFDTVFQAGYKLAGHLPSLSPTHNLGRSPTHRVYPNSAYTQRKYRNPSNNQLAMERDAREPWVLYQPTTLPLRRNRLRRTCQRQLRMRVN